LKFNRDFFQGVPVRLVELKGKKLYDFRDTTTAWSDNPVLALYDYVTNDRYGCGIAAAKIDIPSWTSTANYCDTAGWTLNMAINQDQAAIDVVNSICAHFRGQMVWFDGKYYLRYADMNYESSCMPLTDEHILQGEDGRAQISVSQPSRFQRPDAVRVKFIDIDKNYSVDDIIVGDDTGVVKEISLLGCTDRENASNLGVYNLERMQLDRGITGTFRGDALQLEPHDLVTLTSTAISISGQVMRVRDANILPNGLIELSLAYEAVGLYDDAYNLLEDAVYTCSLTDPTAEPPPVSNATIAEETYNYRLRTFTRLKVAFDAPANYAWFDHVEVWLSYDNATWEHQFNSTSDFELSNVKEGQDYYLRLKTVNIWGVKQQDNNDRLLNRSVAGYIDAPDSVASLHAIVTQNAVNLYAEKLDDTDIELYEFRLGSGWSGGIFLAATRAPNYSMAGVKPGSHTFLINTLGNNGIYGATARSASATLIDPPDGWTVIATETVATLITNGTMEADANWANVGTPATNARSNTQAHEGTYSRKFTVNAANEGIQGDAFTTVTASDYGWSAWVYPDDGTAVRVKIRKGDNSGWIVDTLKSGLTQDAWNFISGTYTESAGGAGAYVIFEGDTAVAGDWYIDDACLVRGTFVNSAPVLYSAVAYIRGLHVTTLVGSYTSWVFDRAGSARYMAYVLGAMSAHGGGTTWAGLVPPGTTWAELDVDRTWASILQLGAGPTILGSLFYGDANPPTTEVLKMEILSAIVTGRYYKVVISITDPSQEIYGYHALPAVKFCQ
jgi:hypothetical protein